MKIGSNLGVKLGSQILGDCATWPYFTLLSLDRYLSPHNLASSSGNISSV